MGVVRGVVFDIDDTLYLERDYLLSGFRAVAEYISASYGACSESLYASMIRLLGTQDRNRIFDILLQEFSQLKKVCTVSELVEVYRSHHPKIQLLEGLEPLFAFLTRSRVRLAIVSDGYLRAQQKKVEALQLRQWFSNIVLTDAWGRFFWKPHHRGFEVVEEELRMTSESLVYIADNPSKDFIAPNSRGWRTVRLRLPGQLYGNLQAEEPYAEAHYTVSGVEELSNLLYLWM